MAHQITVMTYLAPGGVPRPHLLAGHLPPDRCALAAEGLEREVPEWACVSFTHHTLHADVSTDHGEVAALSRLDGRWVPRQTLP